MDARSAILKPRLPLEVAATRPGARSPLVQVWSAQLDSAAWPKAALLPPEERERARRILQPQRRQRWVAARWALRSVLAHCLEADPAAIGLETGGRGKPRLAGGDSKLRFNLSHSSGLALVAVTHDREVGIDLERLGHRSPAFYEAWTRREAVAKCFGSGLGAPLPDLPVTVSQLDVGAGFAAALALTTIAQ